MIKNNIDTVNSKNTFESFVPRDASQETAHRMMSNVAKAIIKNENTIVSNVAAFAEPSLFWLSGPTGVGKSHLMDAVVNMTKAEAPRVTDANRVLVFRDNFTREFIGGLDPRVFEKHTIILVDNLFDECETVSDLDPSSHGIALGNFLGANFKARGITVLSSRLVGLKDNARDLLRRVDSRGEKRVHTALGADLRMDASL